MKHILILLFLFVYNNSYTNKYTKINDFNDYVETDTCDYNNLTLKGLDISRYQKLNYSKIDTSIKFIICKASEGTTLIDRKFKSHWENISENIVKGSYHFFIPHVSGKVQAELYLKVSNLKSGNLLPIVDVEPCWGYRKCSKKLQVKHLQEFVAEIQKQLGVKPIIYTTTHFWNTHYSEGMKQHTPGTKLWIADYRKCDSPKIPQDWESWSIWQYSSKGKIQGILNDVDLNICNVPLDEIRIK